MSDSKVDPYACTCESEEWTADTPRGEDGLDHHPNCPTDKLRIQPAPPRPGAGMLTDRGTEPDPRVSTWHEWVRVSRGQYNHYMNLPLDAADVAHRHHAISTAMLVPHLVAQLEYSWQQVEAWVKWWRNQYSTDDVFTAEIRAGIDGMLDDLRDHLVEGVPLHKPCGPHVEEGEEDRWTP